MNISVITKTKTNICLYKLLNTTFIKSTKNYRVSIITIILLTV